MSSLLQSWRAWSRGRRAVVAALAAAAVAAVAFAVLLQRDARVALFATPLRAEQTAEVVEQLAAWNVAFVAGADNVRVDAARRNALLLRLSLAGVPHAHVTTSHESLANVSPLTPQSVLDEQERSGLAGDVAQALRGFAGIDDAQVIVAPAVRGTFADDPSHPATASVRVSMRAGAPLRHDELEAVRTFVAAAVPGLDAAHVALLDDRGAALGDDGARDGDAETLQRSLQTALDAAFGAGATIVRVRVAYDPRARDLRETIETPLAPLRTATVDERYANAGKTYAKRHASEERGSDVRDERTQTPAGRLERISVAVAVDRAHGLEVAKIASLASATLGLDPGRGDTLHVEEVAFRTPPVAHVPLWPALFGVFAAVAPLVAGLALAAVAVRHGAAPLANLVDAAGRRIAVRRSRTALAGVAPVHVRGVLRGEPPHTAAAIISALPAATATAVLELYPPEERAAIVRRMARAASPAVPDYESVLRRA